MSSEQEPQHRDKQSSIYRTTFIFLQFKENVLRLIFESPGTPANFGDSTTPYFSKYSSTSNLREQNSLL